MEIKKEDILELMERFEASSLSRMNFTQENISIEFEKTPGGEMPAASAAKQGGTGVPQEAASSEAAPAKEQEGTPVKAPLAGVFYRAPSPDAGPFVKKGQTVRKGEVVGIIEAMKMMNEITAPVSGVVKEINTENSAFAQYGDVLMIITEE